MTYPSPAFDINGNLVTIDLQDGDYSNLPAGYYITPGRAALARAVSTSTGNSVPPVDQSVSALWESGNAATQAAVQDVLDGYPPPIDYTPPTPPAAVGWIAPAVAVPPTAAEMIAAQYIINGYTPPPAEIITAIANGTVSPPITEPLPPAATAGSNPAPLAVTAPQPNTVDLFAGGSQRIGGMTVYNDTAAFSVTTPGGVVMQLIDADGHLVQWVPGSVQPFYVTTAPVPGETRLIGADQDGNPIFQIIDEAGHLVQWGTNMGQTVVIHPPFYVDQAAPESAADTGGGTPPPETTDLSRPQVQVGTTPLGYAIYQLQDSAGTVKQWVIDPGPPSAIRDLINVPAYGTLVRTTYNTAGGNEPGGGATHAGGNVTAAEVGSPARATVQVGTTPRGWGIFQLVDEAGTVKQWVINPGPPSAITDLINVSVYGTLVHTTATDAGAPAGGGATPMATATGKSSSAVLLLALGAAGLYLWNNR